MEVHILLLSTMTPEDTAVNLEPHNITFDTQEGTIQKFKWNRKDRPVSVSLWVVCLHPLFDHLAPSCVPHMDAVLCWYHDHVGISCLQVKRAMALLQGLHSNVRMMVTLRPEKLKKHASRIRRYYNEHGFEIERLCATLDENIENILKVHLDIQKNL